MTIPEFTLRQLLEAGVHFGHQTHRWNPRMEQYIYGSRNGIHIIDLTQTVPMLDAALNVIQQTVSKGGTILFVGTKRQASTAIADAAERSAQYFMNHRWLGGTLTNWKTISNSISRLKFIDEQLEEGAQGMTKKERLGMEREQTKLQASLGGIREMSGLPDLLFVIDVKREALAITEANKLGIPVIAVVDSNCAPEGVDYMIPGNDDAARAIQLYCDLAARSALEGMSAQLDAAGVDLGEMEEVTEEVLSSDILAEEVLQEVTPETVVKEAKPEAVAKEIKAETVVKEVTPETVVKEVTPETVVKEVTPETVAKEVTPETVVKEAKPEAVAKEIKAETVVKEVTPETVVKEVTPETVVKEVTPETVAKEAKPKAVAKEIKAETVAEKTED